MGNEMRRERYWEEERKRVCRVCGWKEETWEHVGSMYGMGWGKGVAGDDDGDTYTNIILDLYNLHGEHYIIVCLYMYFLCYT